MLNRSFIKKPTLNLFLETLKDDLKYSLPISAWFLITFLIMANDFFQKFGTLAFFMILIIASYRSIFGFFAIFITIKNFCFLYSPKKSDAFFSLPVKKTELFLIRAISSLISAILPILFLLLGLAAKGSKVFSAYGNKEVSYFVEELSFVCLICLSTMLFAVISGKIFSVVTTQVSSFAILSVIYSLIVVFNKRFLIGYNGFAFEPGASPIAAFTSGVSNIGQFIIDTMLNKNFLTDGNNGTLKEVIGRFVLAAFCFALAWVLFLLRKNDCRSNAFVFKGLHFVMAVLIGFVGFAVLIKPLQTENNIAFLFKGSLLAFVLALVFGICVNKGFKKLWISALAGLCSVALACGYAGSLWLFGEAFIKIIPNPETVESVSIDLGEGFIIDSAPSDEIYALHKKVSQEVLEHIKENHDTKNTGLTGRKVDIEYTLKNGSKFSRSLWCQKKDIKTEVLESYLSEEYFEYAKSLIDRDNNWKVTAKGFKTDHYTMDYEYAQKLYRAQIEDRKTLSAENLILDINRTVQVTVSLPGGQNKKLIFFVGENTVDMMEEYTGVRYRYFL